MKLFKRKLNFRLFGVRCVITLSTYRYGYRQEEKKMARPCIVNKSNDNLASKCICGKTMNLIAVGTTDKWYFSCECGHEFNFDGSMRVGGVM